MNSNRSAHYLYNLCRHINTYRWIMLSLNALLNTRRQDSLSNRGKVINGALTSGTDVIPIDET